MKHTVKWRQGLVGVGLLSVTTASLAFDDDVISRGEYLARAGDCVACHTAPGGEPFAGGLGVESPFGAIYSTNITPDPETGIGNYSRDEFAAALRQGERADGKHLYPAMPYPSYSLITDEDIDALYAYFMEGVAPVEHTPERTDLSFPFNQRWGIGLWDWLFTNDETFSPDPERSDEQNRGAYLVQGLGHCGSCHTERGLFFQEKALDDSDDAFLAGEVLEGWYAPSLRGSGDGGSAIERWDDQAIVDYLATGRNDESAVAGEMTSVVAHSTSHLNESDLQAIAAYLNGLGSHGDRPLITDAQVDETDAMLTRADVENDLGARLYLDNCNACHFSNGRGASQVFPSLSGSSMVNADDPTGMIRVILAGARLPSTEQRPEALAMPDFAWRLSDDEVAELATFVRGAWGNDAGAVSASAVAEVRDELPEDRVTSAPVIDD
ncbi:cytochrome c [Halomonas sp. GD1P12]|uniref:cytochrome c n=1 Tax=Halomonas sp. GD1P12 TaxID=2982691 RepID=UPI0021E3BDBE|nr:cytochrome c [Halomonas sp. GD1P12]UYF99815.1 cytochrome c [Halomonas sp. GD1P12]